jgi:Lrp/AsnC family leucine-responsive transcriptional regulator
VKLLEESGLIRQYVGLLDQRQLGLQVTAYVSVRMEKQPEEEQDEFHQLVAKEAHIV